MASHLFIVRGEADRLACDAWMAPGDARERHAEDGPRPWPVRVDRAGEGYLDGVRRFLAEVRAWLPDRPRWFARARPLVAVPLAGGTSGGVDPRRDQPGGSSACAALVELLLEGVQRDDCDVALVVPDAASFAAAQAARRRAGREPWAALDGSLRERARALAGRAGRGELALFLGAGVSAGAGLPLWGQLLDRLADRAHMAEGERQALHRLNPLDQAAIVERRLGGPAGLERTLRQVFTRRHYALAHALLAALPVREVVTTNYDELFEMAWEALGRRPAVLPYVLRPDADGWLLKLHGCVSHPRDIVLTREDHLGFGEQHHALAGVAETLLITRHMLFVGFSLTDDNFHRITSAVRRAVHARAEGEDAQSFGTALMLERNPLVEELWEGELEWVSMNGSGDRPADKSEASRRLDVFLDYLRAELDDPAHLLDPRYPALLTEGEGALREALLAFERGLSPAARQTAAWERLAAVLGHLGLPGRRMTKDEARMTKE